MLTEEQFEHYTHINTDKQQMMFFRNIAHTARHIELKKEKQTAVATFNFVIRWLVYIPQS